MPKRKFSPREIQVNKVSGMKDNFWILKNLLHWNFLAASWRFFKPAISFQPSHSSAFTRLAVRSPLRSCIISALLHCCTVSASFCRLPTLFHYSWYYFLWLSSLCRLGLNSATCSHPHSSLHERQKRNMRENGKRLAGEIIRKKSMMCPMVHIPRDYDVLFYMYIPYSILHESKNTEWHKIMTSTKAFSCDVPACLFFRDTKWEQRHRRQMHSVCFASSVTYHLFFVCLCVSLFLIGSLRSSDLDGCWGGMHTRLLFCCACIFSAGEGIEEWRRQHIQKIQCTPQRAQIYMQCECMQVQAQNLQPRCVGQQRERIRRKQTASGDD